MPKESGDEVNEDMLEEYDFSEGVRGKYAQRYELGSSVVVLDPDVALVFPDSASVNRALRALVEIIKRRQREKLGGGNSTAAAS